MFPVLLALLVAAGGDPVPSNVAPARPEGSVSADAGAKAPSIEELLDRLDEDDAARRDGAVDTLARVASPEIWKDLRPKLSSDSSDTRRAAIRLVRQLRIERADQVLTQLLRGDADPKVRRDAAHALAEIAPEKAVDRLRTAAFLDREAAVRRAAVQDLGRIGSIAAANALCDVLEDAITQDDAYFTSLAERALTLATGQTHGTNLEGWRHWLASRPDERPPVIVTVEDT